MRTRSAHSPNQAFLIPAMDLLTLLTLAFLVVGTIEGMVLTQEVADETGMPQVIQKRDELSVKRQTLEDLEEQLQRLLHERDTLSAGLPNAVDQRRVHGEIDRVHQAIADVKHTIAKLSEEGHGLTYEVKSLGQQLETAGTRKQELQEMAAELKDRTAELDRLKSEKQGHQRRLTEIQAALARASEDTYALTSGAPMVRRGKVAQHSYLVMLSEGRVIPVEPAYYTGKQRDDGAMVVWPKEKQAGLTIQQAIKANSPVMKEVATPQFRNDGRVKMLVNADSFDTFRVLRDVLVKKGIDYGWEPVEGTHITLAKSGGRNIESQGGKSK